MGKYEEILAAFESRRNEENAGRMAAYMRNRFIFFGLPSAPRRAVYKEFLKAEKRAGRIDWGFLDRCWDDERREFQYLVIDYLDVMRQSLTYEDIPRLERYVRTRQWWDTIDGLDRIIGDIAFDDDRVNALMLRWSADEDFWVRRVAIDHQLGRKKKTDTVLLEKIIVNNFGSREFFINKAIGWSLREYSKTDPVWVSHFISRHRERMSALSLREASRYLPDD